MGQIGGRKGDFSNFVETAVRERLGQVVQALFAAPQARTDNPEDDFGATLDAIRDRARALSEAQVRILVSEAVDATHGHR